MAAIILVSYATKYGSTKEAAELIAQSLQEASLPVDLQPANSLRQIEQYEFIILGAPLIMFHWHKDAMRFIKRHKQSLQWKRLILFALGPISVPYVEKEWQGARAQLDKELNKFPWLRPMEIQIFGGRFDLSKAGFFMKKFAVNIPPSDAMDLQAIRDWSSSLVNKYSLISEKLD